MTIEYWVRLIRLPFVIGLALAGYLALLLVAEGWQRTFFMWMLLPFMLTTLFLEISQLVSALRRRRNS